MKITNKMHKTRTMKMSINQFINTIYENDVRLGGDLLPFDTWDSIPPLGSPNNTWNKIAKLQEK